MFALAAAAEQLLNDCAGKRHATPVAKNRLPGREWPPGSLFTKNVPLSD
jgi:hypothetical protein